MTEYDRIYFEQTTLGLTGNPVGDAVNKIIYYGAPAVRALMVKRFLNPETVLDIGCGKGNLVLWLRRLGVKAYGVDISNYALENAHKPIKKYLSKAGIADLPFENSGFDLVVTFNLLEHINEKDLPRAIDESRRVAKRWVLHKIWGTSRFEQRFPVSDPTHVTVKPNRWWREKLFTELGLKPASRFLPKWEAGIFFLAKE